MLLPILMPQGNISKLTGEGNKAMLKELHLLLRHYIQEMNLWLCLGRKMKMKISKLLN